MDDRIDDHGLLPGEVLGDFVADGKRVRIVEQREPLEDGEGGLSGAVWLTCEVLRRDAAGGELWSHMLTVTDRVSPREHEPAPMLLRWIASALRLKAYAIDSAAPKRVERRPTRAGGHPGARG